MYGIIYKATNVSNGKVYIGQTTQTLPQRQQAHKSLKYCRLFHRALMKYGFESFVWEVVETCESKEELDRQESFWVQTLQSNTPEHGYNIKSGGYGNGRHAIATRQALSLIAKAQNRRPSINPMKNPPEELRARMSHASGGQSFECRTTAGEFIGIFVSVGHAATYLGLHRHHIRNNLKGRTRVCSGYVFTYLRLGRQALSGIPRLQSREDVKVVLEAPAGQDRRSLGLLGKNSLSV